jgi:hypothetical protein
MSTYKNSVQALYSLLHKGGKITVAPETVTITSSGLEYYSLELCDDSNNTQYGLRAYGTEAIELYNEAKRNLSCIVKVMSHTGRG